MCLTPYNRKGFDPLSVTSHNIPFMTWTHMTPHNIYVCQTQTHCMRDAVEWSSLVGHARHVNGRGWVWCAAGSERIGHSPTHFKNQENLIKTYSLRKSNHAHACKCPTILISLNQWGSWSADRRRLSIRLSERSHCGFDSHLLHQVWGLEGYTFELPPFM